MARPSRRQLLADDARRATGFLGWVIEDAERLEAAIPETIASSRLAWRAWTELLETWAANADDDQPPLITRPHDWPKD
jgi:hypothetical protein